MEPVPHRTLTAAGRAALAVVLVAAALAGCGGGQVAVAKPRRTITLSLQPSPGCNHGRPLHAVVRAVTLKQFVEEPDSAIAQLVVSPDDSVLAAFVVFPGVDQSITVEPPAKGTLAVYFLFTGATGSSWKQRFDGAPAHIRLELGDDRILTSSTQARAVGNRPLPRYPDLGSGFAGSARHSMHPTHPAHRRPVAVGSNTVVPRRAALLAPEPAVASRFGDISPGLAAASGATVDFGLHLPERDAQARAFAHAQRRPAQNRTGGPVTR